MKLPYWVFVQDSNPIGIVIVGQEPIQLLAPPGTSMAFVDLLDTEQPSEVIGTFANEALRLMSERRVTYALAKFRYEKNVAMDEFKKLAFKEFDDCYQMICTLDRSFKPSGELKIRRVEKEEMRQFIEMTEEFMQSSPDIALRKAMEYISELPDEFLNSYYDMEEFFIAHKNDQPVGILNINTRKGLVSNVGVAPSQRGKGYGRQVMLFGLDQLKRRDCKQAYLRVHVENKQAIHLYESLGFTKANRYKRLMWKVNGKQHERSSER